MNTTIRTTILAMVALTGSCKDAGPAETFSDNETVHPTAIADTVPGDWDLIFADEFNGAADSPASEYWLPGPSWAEGPRPGTHAWRDAIHTGDECRHDGLGSLVLTARMVGDERRACYLTTGDTGDSIDKWRTFGPGENGTFIEFRANISQMRSHAAWFAMWLMAPTNTYDSNPDTGTEIDVMEYVPFEGPQYSLNNLFHSAVFWGSDEDGRTEPPHEPPMSDEYGQVNASVLGADLREDEFHTWGLEWYRDTQRFYFDGQMFWENRRGVSTSDNHALRLSIEIANGNPYNLWGHAVGRFEDNPPTRQASARVDYVRVFRRRAESGSPDTPETGAPSAPGNLRGEVYSRSAVEIFWERSIDSDGQVVLYEVSRDGSLLTSRDAGSYFEDGLQPGASYQYQVVAVDNEGKRSAASTVTLTTRD